MFFDLELAKFFLSERLLIMVKDKIYRTEPFNLLGAISNTLLTDAVFRGTKLDQFMVARQKHDL